MPSHPGVKKLRDMLNRPGFIYALGIWDPYTARVSESMGMQCVHIGGYQLGIGNCTSEPLITLTELAYTTRMVSNAVIRTTKRSAARLLNRRAPPVCILKTRFFPSVFIIIRASNTP